MNQPVIPESDTGSRAKVMDAFDANAREHTAALVPVTHSLKLRRAD
jgi:ABC-type lipoprotein export system ATPase subunit